MMSPVPLKVTVAPSRAGTLLRGGAWGSVGAARHVQGGDAPEGVCGGVWELPGTSRAETLMRGCVDTVKHGDSVGGG